MVVTSDHGDMLGSHGQRHKRKPWEESIHVPGIVRYPRAVKAGRVETRLVTHVDLAPTLLGLCGLPVPADMQGTDLSRSGARTRHAAAQPRPSSRSSRPFFDDDAADPWRGVRTTRFMYARTEAGPWVLYDLKADPYEQHNLATDPAARGHSRRDGDAQLADWMTRTGDSWSLNSKVPVEDKARLYRFETFYTIDELSEVGEGPPGPGAEGLSLEVHVKPGNRGPDPVAYSVSTRTASPSHSCPRLETADADFLNLTFWMARFPGHRSPQGEPQADCSDHSLLSP